MKTDIKVIDIDGRTTICSWDKYEHVWTLSLLEAGGPIIWNRNFETAVKEFKEALKVCLAVDVLLMFDRMSKAGASDEEIKEAWKERRGL